MTLRIIIALLGTYACALIFANRAGMSVAIVSMTVRANASNTVDVSTCRTGNHTSNDDTDDGKYYWSESLQGVVLGAGYYMYLFTSTMAGRFADKFGAKWFLAVVVFAPSIFSALTPIAASYHIWLVIVVRTIIGACHGCVYAALFALYAHWFPSSERPTAIAGLSFGALLGSIITFPAAGYLCEYGFADGWPSVFYVISLAHVPWILAWIYFVDDKPSESKRISIKELNYIHNKIDTTSISKRSTSAPWKAILTSKPVWASIWAKILSGWGLNLMMSKMPSYLDTVFGISILDNGFYNAMITLAMGVTVLCGGPLSALVIAKTNLSKTRIRKIFEDIALLGPAVCFALIPTMGCDSTAVIILLILAMLLFGLNTGGEYPIVSELAPDLAGTVFGVVATVSIIPAFVTPYVVGVMLDGKPGDKSPWNLVFYITVALYLIAVIIFELWASAEPQPWGVIEDQTEENNKNKTNNEINSNSTIKIK